MLGQEWPLAGDGSRCDQQQQMTAALSARLALITTLLRRRDEVVRLVALL